MKRFLLASAALLFAGSAHAETITIDDFNTAQTVIDTTNDGSAVSTVGAYTIDGNAFTRTLRVNQNEHGTTDPSLASKADIGFGYLKLSNDSQTNSLIDVSYNIDSLLDDVSGASEIMLDVIFADASVGIAFTIEGYLNGTLIGSQTFTGPGSLTFALPGLAESGNVLRLAFSGGTSFDSTLGPITIEADTGGGGIPVPEPGALGLLGLGLMGVAIARRRKATA